jgi:hypothetical protein
LIDDYSGNNLKPIKDCKPKCLSSQVKLLLIFTFIFRQPNAPKIVHSVVGEVQRGERKQPSADYKLFATERIRHKQHFIVFVSNSTQKKQL